MESIKTAAVHWRLAAPEDGENISNVLSEAFWEFRHLYTEKAMEATVITPEEARRRMAEGPVWLVELDGETVATASVLLKEEEAYLRGMAVLPAARGLKIGLALLLEAEKFALTNHCGRLFLRTTPYLHKAIQLYEQFGFVRISGSEEPFFGTPSFLMEKALP